MLIAKVDNSIRKIILQTDDSSIRYLLESTKKETKYIPWQKKWGTVTTTSKIYDEKKPKPDEHGIWTFTLGLGWAGYIINVFKGYLSQNDYNDIVQNAILSPVYRDVPFPELRDYQNEDVLHILKYRIALFSCMTGYGKTSVIATLANYAYSMGDSVLIITPGKKANDEIVSRCEKVFGLKVPSDDLRINNMITNGFLNRKDVKDPSLLPGVANLLGQYKWILVDECEYTMNESGEAVYSLCTGAERMYAFSGTSDKKSAAMISFMNGLDDVVIRNKDLIKYFGPSLVYRMPMNISVDNIKVKTRSLNAIKFDEAADFAENSNVYNNVMNRIWKTPEVCKTIVKIAEKYPRLYIPINNLNSIIEEWIQNYFIGKFRILLICYEGYIYYDLNGNRTKLDGLNEAWDYVNRGLVDVIPSTSSGYRALDLPGLESILLIQGMQAGIIIQAIGRCARGTHMNIIGLEPAAKKKIPVYSKGVEERDEMIHTYYKYCDVVDSIIYEDNL